VVYPPICFPYARTALDRKDLDPEDGAWKIEMATDLFSRVKV